MLGKLIKHEWKSTYKMGCLMLVAIVILTFLGWLSFQVPMWESLSYREGPVSWMEILSVMSVFMLIAYVVLLGMVTFGNWIYIGVHFYRTMYTDQGYLTHTLPVTKNQILVSKVLVSGLWMLLIAALTNLSLLTLGFSLVWSLSPDWYLPADIWDGAWELLRGMESLLGFRIARVLGMWIVSSITGCFTSAITMFGALSLGQLMARGRGFFGILYYILILTGESLISLLFRSFASAYIGYLNWDMEIQFILQILMAAALYAVSYFVISRKLNLT